MSSCKFALASAAIALAAAPMSAQADEWNTPQPAWEGVWQGTIGSLPVHVCLDATPYEQKGTYYYDRIKQLLPLAPGKASGQWLEQGADDKNRAQWSVAVRDGALVGTWNDGRKRLPLHLGRIEGPSQDFDGPCGSVAFHRARLLPVRLASRNSAKDGERYTVLTFKPGPWFGDDAGITTFALDRGGAAVAKVNALLRADLPKPDGTGDLLDCLMSGANANGQDGQYAETIVPTLITQRWLSARQQGEYYCGGAHPENTDALRTFDLARGVEVNPLEWLNAKAAAPEGEASRTLTPAFRAFLLSGWKGNGADSECDDAVRTQDYWHVGLERGALVFTPEFPRAIMACTEDFRVAFARLAPWLNDHGKSAVATLPR
jgi:hypothetical protein